MINFKNTTITTLLLALLTTIMFSTGCTTIMPKVENEKQEINLAKQTGFRIPEATFDTDFSREEYTIIGLITGEGTVIRRLVEEGSLQNKEPRKVWSFSKEAKAAEKVDDDYTIYVVYDYDRSYGTWADEGLLEIDALGDYEMSTFYDERVTYMEKIAARIALYNALSSNPEIDAVLLPRYEFHYVMEDEIKGQEYVVARKVISVTAKVYGKAIRIKTDEELAATYKEFPSLLNALEAE